MTSSGWGAGEAGASGGTGTGAGAGAGAGTGSGWGRYIRTAASQYYNHRAAGTADEGAAVAPLQQPPPSQSPQPGARRKKLMQVASSVANNYYQRYANQSAGELERSQPPLSPSQQMGIAAAAAAERCELWLFPSYARQMPASADDGGAVCEVNVNGWLFMPHVGVHSRKTRWQLGLIRWMCGLSNQSPNYPPEDAEAATPPEEELFKSAASHTDSGIGPSTGGGGESVAGRNFYSWRNGPSDSPQPAMSAAQLRAANEALEERIAPFTHTPARGLPVSIFFYDAVNDIQAERRSLLTQENGHFSCSAALPFVPTHVRVLASETLSATEPVTAQPPCGISVISDIDDTVKNSGVMLGAREMAKATFTAPVGDFVIDGVADWYRALAAPPFNCALHYISNSPWQLYPVLRSFFDQTGLPPGSFHLKHYVGMLQGALEPAADRKRGTVERVMQDFPDRKFLLIGDSGEADLEVYAEMAERWPDRVLAICIRDITTRDHPLQPAPPPKLRSDGTMVPLTERRYRGRYQGYGGDGSGSDDGGGGGGDDDQQSPLPPPRPMPSPSLFIHGASPPLPARPEKPVGLRGGPPVPRKPASLRQEATEMPPLAHSRSAESLNRPRPHPPLSRSPRPPPSPRSPRPPPPPPRRAAISTSEDHQAVRPLRTPPQRVATVAPVMSGSWAAPTAPATKAPRRAATATTAVAAAAGDVDAPPPRTKAELAWERRWQTARERLEPINVKLLSWRVGSDLKDITRRILEQALANMG